MIVLADGKEYDTNVMDAIQITEKPYPAIYVAHDFSAFILVSFNQWTGVTAQSLSPEEFRTLGRIYNLPALLKIIEEMDRQKP